MLTLLTQRRFGPLFATQFLSAFNDNLYRTAMVFLISFELLADDPAAAAFQVTIAAAVFILPFLLFSGTAGQLADRADKTRVARWIKAAEIVILGAGAFALHLGSIPFMMLVLFLTGTHSAFFGPIKYAILPQHLERRELMTATGLIEAGTFVAILLGQVAGGLIGHSAAAFGIVAIAVIGWLFALAMPPAPPTPDPHPLSWNPWTSGAAVVRGVWRHRRQREAMLAISWFWALGAVFTSQFVPLARHDLQATPAIATLFLAVFSVGVALGSMVAGRLTRGVISGRPTPFAALALAAFGLDLFLAIGAYRPAGEGLAAFLANPGGWRILFDLLAIAVAGGVFIVPLYAVLQSAADAGERSRAIAGNNIVNAAFMVGASGIAAALLAAGLSVAQVLLLFGLANLPVAARLWQRRALLTA